MTKEEFNNELKVAVSEELRGKFLQKYLVHGTPFVFNGSEEKYFDFRSRIAQKFNVETHEVFIVGSAKLGFSYEKGTDFSLESDVDVVIVNEKLFDFYHKEICSYQYELDKFYQGITVGENEQYTKFMKYFIKGWMRPDLLPSSFKIEALRKEWFQYFTALSHGRSEIGNYKVSAGLFKSMIYFERYHLQSINRQYQKIII